MSVKRANVLSRSINPRVTPFFFSPTPDRFSRVLQPRNDDVDMQLERDVYAYQTRHGRQDLWCAVGIETQIVLTGKVTGGVSRNT